ncbi:hypothetical protein [Amycolatopsis nalaikhensis]|uniref:Uncharacterized protein n=1 Tax=Amycolatopsis nalaikhensis TaxID=715472 RepID=A0ABY8XYC6_9PSEU|nr:hypothetical protein [Amycolatopsis sp. 2-2]WIV60735.1 hypothetical protein QP939_20030 [Amycolatopsis sp. 2-2]
MQEPLRAGQELAGQGDRLGLVVTNLFDVAVAVDLQDPRAGHGERDR